LNGFPSFIVCVSGFNSVEDELLGLFDGAIPKECQNGKIKYMP